MRKNTKMIAIMAVSSLFAAMASMSSFAAGWTEESGSWAFYNKDGSAVTNDWKKSGNNWYWLDSDGLMAVDQLVNDDDDYYYVDSNGVRVTNQWVQIENTDDNGEDAPSSWWYYFQGNGKAYTANDSGVTSLRVINGKKYAFTDEGKMLFGWVDDSSTRQTDDDAWSNCNYYFGDEDDGAAAIGWTQLHVIDRETDRWDLKDEESDDQDYWFYFQTNGKKLYAKNSDVLKTKTINGIKYGFDQTGRMVFEWTETTGRARGNSTSSMTGWEGSSSVAGYNYFSDRDNGARVSKGWFKVVPNEDINQKDSDDEKERWYYAYSVGKLCASEFKTINGKRYCFNNSGQMLTNLQAVYTDELGRVWNRALDDEDLLKDATSLKFGGTANLYLVNEDGYEIQNELSIASALENIGLGRHDGKAPTYGVYYFGDDNDGSARTSAQSVPLEGDSYIFYFNKDGEKKGKGVNGLKDNYLYQEGLRVKADRDNKYEVYFIGRAYTDEEKGDSSTYQDYYDGYCYDDESFFLPGHVYQVDPEMINQMIYDISKGNVKVEGNKLYLVNTSGTVSKSNKSGAKDGNDCYYSVSNGKVTGYFSKGDNGSFDSWIGVNPNTGS